MRMRCIRPIWSSVIGLALRVGIRVTLMRVRLTTVGGENQEVLHILNVFKALVIQHAMRMRCIRPIWSSVIGLALRVGIRATLMRVRLTTVGGENQ